MTLISFFFETDQNSFRPENFVESSPGNPGPFLNVGTNTDATTSQIGQTDPLGGVWDRTKPTELGDIFPVGMNQIELSDYLTVAEYASDLARGGTFDLLIVPESADASPVIAGFLIALQSRRRKKPC